MYVGKQEGRQEEKIAIAKNLISLGVANETIVTASGLSIEFVESLSDDIKNNEE